jgi:uncharacterized protein (TIGR03086 family)
MNTEDAGDLALLARVSSDFELLCASIRDSQWSLPTPCTEWNLEQLVDHVVGGNRFTIRILAGESADAAMAQTVTSFDERHEPRTAALESINEQLLVFDAPGVLDGTFHHVAGELTGREVLRIRLHELIIHSWDIAQAANPPASIRDEFVEWAFGEIGEPESSTAELFALDTGALEGERSERALLAAFGRRGT